jgi:hypothetical protein
VPYFSTSGAAVGAAFRAAFRATFRASIKKNEKINLETTKFRKKSIETESLEL